MAKQLGAPTSGSIRADTFSRNSYGSYLRNRSIPVNPNTPAQNLVRSQFITAHAAWRALSDTVQDQWSTYASLHPRTNPLGEQIILSPIAQFIACYAQAHAANLAGPTVPPTDISWATFEPVLTASVETVGPTSVFTVDGANQPTGAVGIVFGAAPTSTGRRTPVTWKQIQISSLTSWVDISVLTNYELFFGPIAIGQRVYLKIHATGPGGSRGPRWQGYTTVFDAT